MTDEEVKKWFALHEVLRREFRRLASEIILLRAKVAKAQDAYRNVREFANASGTAADDNDLNAIDLLVQTLSGEDVMQADGFLQSERGRFNVTLERIVERDLKGAMGARFYFEVLNASARQRREAYFRTIGKWTGKVDAMDNMDGARRPMSGQMGR